MNNPIQLACIIDDDDFYISLVSKIIKLKGLAKKLKVFRNGKEALDFFQPAMRAPGSVVMPRIVLLDLNMPVMDGWQFLSQLEKEDPTALKDTIIYIVSSSIDPKDKARAAQISLVADYIVKPMTIEEVENIFDLNQADSA
ncbi:response regulator [Croceiramulus getboli]|nr:response regulator [Flavobacteriaceae bacterium YJPT1-3]